MAPLYSIFYVVLRDIYVLDRSCLRAGRVARPRSESFVGIFDFRFSYFRSALFFGSFDFLIFTLIFEFVLATRARVPTARLTRARVGSKIYEKHKNFGRGENRTSCILLQLRSKVKILPEGDYEYPASSCSENVEPQPSVFVGRSNPMRKCDHTIQGGNAINLILTLSHQRNFCFRLR